MNTSPASPGPVPAKSKSNVIAGGCLISFMGTLGLLMMLFLGLMTGLPGMIVGICFASLTVPLAISLVLLLDRMEAEPPRLLAMAFFWGATVATFYSLLSNMLHEEVAAALSGDPEVASFVGTVIAAPLNEEFSKALVLFILYYWKKDEFDGIVDGIVYAAMVALGFAAVENVMYYGQSVVEEGLGGAMVTFFLRGIMAPFAHPLFTSMTGIGLGWARQSDKLIVKWLAPLLGLGLAIFLHSLWNLSTEFGLFFFVTYFLFMVPALSLVLMLVFYSSRGEGEVLRQYLSQEVQSGLLTQDEYQRLCDGKGRIRTGWRGLTAGARRDRRAQGEFNQTASELAFHRRRVTRGLVQDPAIATAQEAAYLQRLHDLRGQLSAT